MGPSIQFGRRRRSGLGRSARPFRPSLKGLEQRLLLSLAPVLGALTTYRYWVDYAPSYNSSGDPYNPNPTDAQIKADLTNLYQEGFRGLVTYTLQGSYADIPKIARSVGFQWVIAGVYDPTNATEVQAAASPNVLPYTDAFVVGNEGLMDRRYTYTQLTTAIDQVKQMTGKPVTTSEPGGAYYTPNGAAAPYAAQLLGTGDWLFPNIDYFLWAGQPSTPQFMWTNVSFAYQFMLANQTTPGPVVAKEIAYPSAGGLQASDANQISWYHDYAAANLVAGKPFYFVYFEAYDQPWKSSIDAYEPHLGLNALNQPDGGSQPKPAMAPLQADIMSAYPGTDVPHYASKQGLALAETSGMPFTANVARFTDPNDPIGSDHDHYSASILWGDGGRFEEANVSFSNGTLIVSASHTYGAPGQYTAQVALQRSSGYGEVVPMGVSVAPPTVTHPVVTTQAATAITSTGATLTATVNPEGNDTTVRFVYGPDPTLTSGSTTTTQSAGSGTSAEMETVALSGLAPDTTYFFEVQATNASGTTTGAILSFTTAPGPPVSLPPPVTITSLPTPTIKIGTGKRAKSEVAIELQFSGAVNGVGNLGAYLLQSGKSKKGVTRYTKTVPLTLARYNASTHTLDLVPKSKTNLAAPARLTVTASLITDAFGRPLDGNHDGQPGGNFVAIFSNKGVTIEGTKRPVANFP